MLYCVIVVMVEESISGACREREGERGERERRERERERERERSISTHVNSYCIKYSNNTPTNTNAPSL